MWENAITKKMNIFAWRARLGRLPTRVELDKRGIDLDSILCARCGNEVESIDHALFRCEPVNKLWSLIGKWWKVELGLVTSWDKLSEIGRIGVGKSIGMRR